MENLDLGGVRGAWAFTVEDDLQRLRGGGFGPATATGRGSLSVACVWEGIYIALDWAMAKMEDLQTLDPSRDGVAIYLMLPDSGGFPVRTEDEELAEQVLTSLHDRYVALDKFFPLSWSHYHMQGWATHSLLGRFLAAVQQRPRNSFISHLTPNAAAYEILSQAAGDGPWRSL